MSVVVKNLTKSFDSQIAVDNISFQTGAGEILGFLGPNGAGKSTTMKMICGFLKPSAGEIIVEGHSVLDDPIQAKSHIGYLPENNPLYKDMYVKELLNFFGRLCKIPALSSRVDELIQMTGLENEYKKPVGSLSKGYRQRVGLCQALIHDPKVLILDEPTSGLDPNQLIEIRQLIRTIGKHKTLIFSSHIMQEVEALCQRVIIINKGKIVADNSFHELLQKTHKQRKIFVEFGVEPDETAIRNLKVISNLVKTDHRTYILYCSGEIDPREEIFRLASQRSWPIREMREEKSNIEEVFNLLTKTTDHVGIV